MSSPPGSSVARDNQSYGRSNQFNSSGSIGQIFTGDHFYNTNGPASNPNLWSARPAATYGSQQDIREPTNIHCTSCGEVLRASGSTLCGKCGDGSEKHQHHYEEPAQPHRFGVRPEDRPILGSPAHPKSSNFNATANANHWATVAIEKATGKR